MSEENLKPSRVTPIQKSIDRILEGITEDMLIRLIQSYTKIPLKRIRELLAAIERIERDLTRKRKEA